MDITVLGSGGWGTALSLLLLQNRHKVTLWAYRRETAETLRRTRTNARLPGVSLPEELAITDQLETVEGSEMVVIATPSYAVRETARQLSTCLRSGAILVSAAKGVERDTFLRLTQVIGEETGGRFPLAALSGPSHAEEVGRNMPTGCVAASEDIATAQIVQNTFMGSRFRVYTNTDLIGVELGGALKNVLALCSGISDGMKLGDNAKALLMTRGITEMARLGMSMGGRKETFAGLSGIGDLMVTCTSEHSRNRQCGIRIGQGVPVPEAMRQVGATVEGYYAAFSAHQLAQKQGVEMPICQCAYEVLYHNQPVSTVVESLMCRERRHEVDESWI